MPVVNAVNQLLEECPATATEPCEVGIRFPFIIGIGVVQPLDLKLSRFISLEPAERSVLGWTRMGNMNRRGRGLLAGVVNPISLELSHVARFAYAQVLRYIKLESILSACLQEPVQARKPLLQNLAQPGAILLLDGVAVTCGCCVAERRVACVEKHGVAGLEVMRLSGLVSGV